MKKELTLSCLLMWLSLSAMATDEQSVVEIRGDRIIIYPQRMELTGEETLLDILEMYPDLMGAGFDDVLEGNGIQDSYQLRLENVAISSDMRLTVTQMKAALISKIQICHNAGVAKGRIGDGRVIDVNLLRADSGAHGFLSLQGSSNKLLAPSANLRYGSEKTDIWSALTYTHEDGSGWGDREEKFHFQMTNRFSPRDLLRTYVTQSSSRFDQEADNPVFHGRNRSLMARFRYFHTFNDQGTELLTMLSWAHQYTPSESYQTDSKAHINESQRTHSPVWLLELNTPLFSKNLSLMAGYEGGLDFIRYHYDDTSDTSDNEHSRYQVMSNALYLQLNYVLGMLRLTVGDRVMFYHYKRKGESEEWSHNDTRNNFQASAILTPHKGHQVQLAYYRKFHNPLVISSLPLEEIKTDQYKLSYAYSRKTFSGQLDGSIYRTDGSTIWVIDGSVYKKIGVLSLTAGFNVYNAQSPSDERLTFADIRLVPVVRLPLSLQLSAKLIWYSSQSPYRVLNENTAFYGALQADKQFGRHWNLHAEWHDMFYCKQSAALVGIMYRF